jgi:insertion element IS1 protein InsB
MRRMSEEENKRMQCPRCQGSQVVKNGTIHSGKPKWKCKACGRQFVATVEQRRIPAETKVLVDKLLLERISLAGIVRTTGVSARWLQYYVNKKYEHQPRSVTVSGQKGGA